MPGSRPVGLDGFAIRNPQWMRSWQQRWRYYSRFGGLASTHKWHSLRQVAGIGETQVSLTCFLETSGPAAFQLLSNGETRLSLASERQRQWQARGLPQMVTWGKCDPMCTRLSRSESIVRDTSQVYACSGRLQSRLWCMGDCGFALTPYPVP